MPVRSLGAALLQAMQMEDDLFVLNALTAVI